MKLLLDTHIWIWSVVDPKRLSDRVRRALTKRSNELWLSSISVWEALVLLECGKVRLKGSTSPAQWVGAALAAAPIREAPLTNVIAVGSRVVPLPHHDPADRFIVATAIALDLTLVTADSRVIESKSVPVLANSV